MMARVKSNTILYAYSRIYTPSHDNDVSIVMVVIIIIYWRVNDR